MLPTPEPEPYPAPPSIPLPTQTPVTLRLSVGNTTYTINGIPAQSDVAPFIDPVHSRTMVPLVIIAEGLGSQVSWVEATRTVVIVHGSQTLSIQVDAPLPEGMGQPAIVDGRTFVPIAYVSQMLGAQVTWDEVNRAVYIQQ
ncbi:MAG: copper amine oxidase N-terminal domain-containing protein [Defluviitaleaceae bacterium]|nr:copper amine oxidase N-terminal domain-containing protein [Defluviitaleaceae bacterium]